MTLHPQDAGRGAGIGRRPFVACVVLGSVLLTGCAVPADGTDASPAPEPRLAERAEVDGENERRPSAVRKRRHKAQPRAEHTGASRVEGDEEGRGSRRRPRTDPAAHENARPESGWRPLSTTTDQAADHGDGPGYADITVVSLADRGADVRLAVTVAGVLPGRLAPGEVQGVGVDIYRSNAEESDFQVFFDGGDHGWRAFLQTPDGFVRFPGTFSVSGRTLSAVVPWAALGGPADGDASAFADWSSGVGRLSADGVARQPFVAD